MSGSEIIEIVRETLLLLGFILFYLVWRWGCSKDEMLIDLHHCLGHSKGDKHSDVLDTACAARKALDKVKRDDDKE